MLIQNTKFDTVREIGLTLPGVEVGDKRIAADPATYYLRDRASRRGADRGP
jgi:2-keto-4-pentenoate hydratase